MASEDTTTTGVAGRYATALFELANDTKSLPAVEDQLGRFEQLLAQSEDLRRLVRSPVFSTDDQIKALQAVTKRAEITGLAANFLLLIARNRRLFAAPDMIRSFKALAARSRGEITADVTSAVALNDEQVATLKAALKSQTGKDVKLDAKVDPAILGGLIVKLGSKMVDSSLKTKLDGLKIAMKGAG